MSRVRYRLEVWDRTNSTRLAYAATVSELRRHRVLKGEETLAARITLHDYAAGRVQTGAVLRVQKVGDPTSYTLWRITGREKVRTPDGSVFFDLAADALWMDLRHGRVRQVMSDGRSLYTWGLVDVDPETWIQDVILPCVDASGVTFELGVCELTTPVSLSFDRTSPLEALRMLEQACTEAEGGAELQFRVHATGTGYLVDLLHRVGATSGGAELRYRKNVQGIRRREDESAIATRIYAVGSGMLTLAEAEWELAGVSGPTSARVLTFAGMHPVFETGAFVGLWFYVPGKAAYPITASNAQAGTLTVTGTGRPALAAGDVGWIATSESGTRLDYLQSPAGVDAYGVRAGDLSAEDIPDAINLLPNGDFSDWSGGLPVGWSAEGSPTIEESTDHAQRGGKAVHVTAAADGEGLVSDAVDVYQTDARPYTGMRVELTVISGQVRIELRHSNGTVYPVQQRPMSTGLGVALELSANVHDEPLPEGTVQLAIVAHGGPAEWYLDAAMVTPIVADEVPAWVKRSGAWELWRRTAQHLATARQPRLEYDVQVVDLHRVAPDLFRFDEIGLGDDVRLIDPDIARETVRVVEIEEEMLSRGVERVVLAPSAELRLHDPYRPAPPGNRHGPVGLEAAGPAEVPRVLSVAAQVDPADGKLYLSPLGNARVATLELYLKTSRTASYPQTPAATLNGRQGTFPGQPLASARYFKVVPKDGRGVAGEAWEGGSESFTPTVGARAVTGSNGTAADIYATPDSPIGESLRVHLRDSDAAGAPVWSLVQGDGDPTPRYVADGTEVGPDSWFYNGSEYAQKLKSISLARDQLRRIYVQAEGQLTALRSTWIPIPLELRAQPWLESVTAAWNDAGDSIEVTAIGGAHCQSARYELSKDNWQTVAAQRDVALVDGQRLTESVLIDPADRQVPWRVRVIPFNGPLVGGVASGLAGAPQEAAVPPYPKDIDPDTDPHLTLIQARWVYGVTQELTSRGVEVEIEYSDRVARLVFDVVPADDPSPHNPVETNYAIAVSGGGHRIELLKESDGGEPLETPLAWPAGYEAPSQIQVQAFDEDDELLTIRTVTITGDGSTPVVAGGTGLASVPQGALLLGAGVDPMQPLLGVSAGQVVAWDTVESAWRARSLGFEDVGGLLPWSRLTGFPSIIAGNGLVGGGTLDQSRTISVMGGLGISVSADQISFDTIWGDNRYALASHRHDWDDIDNAPTFLTPGTGDQRYPLRSEGFDGFDDVEIGAITDGHVLVYDGADDKWKNIAAPWSLLGHTHAWSEITNKPSIIAGNGLTGGGLLDQNRTLHVGAGVGISVSADAVAFDTVWGDARYAAISHRHNWSDIDNAPAFLTAAQGDARYVLRSEGLNALDDVQVSLVGDGHVLAYDGAQDVWKNIPAQWSLIGHNHDDRYLRLIGGDLTGSLALRNPNAAGAERRIDFYTDTDTYWRLIARSSDSAVPTQNDDLLLYWFDGASLQRALWISHATRAVRFDATPTVGTDAIWHEGNFPAWGDARYARKASNETITGEWTFQEEVYAAGGITTSSLEVGGVPVYGVIVQATEPSTSYPQGTIWIQV